MATSHDQSRRTGTARDYDPVAGPSRITAVSGLLCRRRMLRDAFMRLWCVGIFLALPTSQATAQLSVDEQHRISWHRENSIVGYQRPAGPVPVTVSSADAPTNERYLPLDEAIRIALRHSEVIRVLTGTSAASSGQTIYDTAIATTPIDQAVARFDPVFSANSNWRKTRTPGTRIDPGDPLAALLADSRVGGNDLSAGLSKTNRLGGTGALEFRNNWNYGVGGPGALNPVHRPGFDLSYTQPLLAGSGRPANEAPIVIARLDQDRSYYQFKDGIQGLVAGVITGYWSLVEARTQLWAREKQVEQAEAAFARGEALFKTGFADIRDVAQPRVALANFRANRTAAQGNVLQREAALRNLLGLPPEDGIRLVPSTPPTRDRVQFDWVELVDTAQILRPDLVELNLILLADQQRLLQANNQAQPSLNAVAINRWNGISGRMLNGAHLRSNLNDNPSWTLGVNFEVPLGLRSARAAVRSRELLIARDRANVQQGLHAAEHTLATAIRNLDLSYEQYEAFRETRAAARVNLEVQFAERKTGRVIFLNVLLAITDWGNAVSSEATALTQYNSTLATLERETGTILDTHGITFTEQQFAAVGPLGRHFASECYPRSLNAEAGFDNYPDSGQAAEESFDLEDFPGARSRGSRQLPLIEPLKAPSPEDEASQPSNEKDGRFSLRNMIQSLRRK